MFFHIQFSVHSYYIYPDRNILAFLAFFVSMLFYVTPILYTPSYVPDKFAWILKLNPLKMASKVYFSDEEGI